MKCYHLKIESQKILLQQYSGLRKTLCKSPLLDSKPEHCHPNSQRRPRASTAALRLPSMQWWWSVILWIKTWHLHEVSAKSHRWANSCLLWGWLILDKALTGWFFLKPFWSLSPMSQSWTVLSAEAERSRLSSRASIYSSRKKTKIATSRPSRGQEQPSCVREVWQWQKDHPHLDILVEENIDPWGYLWPTWIRSDLNR